MTVPSWCELLNISLTLYAYSWELGDWYTIAYMMSSEYGLNVRILIVLYNRVYRVIVCAVHTTSTHCCCDSIK